jgi:hypothetical protein
VDISRSHSLPRIGPTALLDVERPVEHQAPSVPLTLLGRTYSITPRSNGRLLSGEPLSAFAQACKPEGEVRTLPAPRGGGNLALYRARLQSGSSAQERLMDVVVHLDKNDLPTRMHASEMNFFADSSGQQGRPLFDIRIHNAQPRAKL